MNLHKSLAYRAKRDVSNWLYFQPSGFQSTLYTSQGELEVQRSAGDGQRCRVVSCHCLDDTIGDEILDAGMSVQSDIIPT